MSVHPNSHLLATIDREGCVIVRDLKQSDNHLAMFKPERDDYEPVDTACIALNNYHMINVSQREREDLFIAINNQFYVYCISDQ